MAKVSIKNYTKPRPIWMMVVGDTCIYAGGLVGAMSVSQNQDTITYASLALMVFGFFFSKMFAAIEKERQITIEESFTTKTTQATTITEKKVDPKEEEN